MQNFALAGYFRRLAGASTFLAAFLLTSTLAPSIASAAADAEPYAQDFQANPEMSVARQPSPDFLPPPFDRVPTKGKAIYVNVPSFELIAFEDGKEVLRSRTVVGTKTYPTPDLTTETSVVRFRPTWKPTPSMIRDKGTSPHTRPPGPNNPLGLLAIRLDPGMLIYLHGTNEPKLFERENRALSHGCIRVEKWDEVAAFVLGTSVEDVHTKANGSRTFDMDTEGVPVFVRYETSFPDPNGILREYPDVYGRHAAYAAALQSTPDSDFAWDQLPASWGE